MEQVLRQVHPAHRAHLRAVLERCPPELQLRSGQLEKGGSPQAVVAHFVTAAARRLEVARGVALARGRDAGTWAAIAPAVWAMELGWVWLFARKHQDTALFAAVEHLDAALSAMHAAMTHPLPGLPIVESIPESLPNAPTVPAFLDSMLKASRASVGGQMTLCMAGGLVCGVLRVAAPHSLPRDACATAAAIVRASLEPQRASKYREQLQWVVQFAPTIVRLGVAHFALPPLLQRRLFEGEPRDRQAMLLASVALSAALVHGQGPDALGALQEVHLAMVLAQWAATLERRVQADPRFAQTFLARAMAHAADLQVGGRVLAAWRGARCRVLAKRIAASPDAATLRRRASWRTTGRAPGTVPPAPSSWPLPPPSLPPPSLQRRRRRRRRWRPSWRARAPSAPSAWPPPGRTTACCARCRACRRPPAGPMGASRARCTRCAPTAGSACARRSARCAGEHATCTTLMSECL